MKRKLASLSMIFLLLCSPAFSTNHYILSGVSGGAGTGVDWTNACADLTGSCAPTTRGDVYYVGTGTYSGSYNFNTAASGTTLITVKGATAADHGTSTGWSNSFGVDVTQATFSGNLDFSTSYWVFDGNTATPVWSETATQYGFKTTVNSGGCGSSGPITIANDTTAMSNVTVSHVAATATSSDTAKCWISTDNSTKAVTNITISHNYLNGWENCFWATSAGLTMSNWVFEYNVDLNGYSSATNHGECVNNNFGLGSNWVVAFNLFQGTTGSPSCQTGVIVANNNDQDNIAVYGNVFDKVGGCNGIVTGTSSGTLVSPLIYNNTFTETNTSSGPGCPCGPWVQTPISGTPVVQNNLLWNMDANSGAPSGGDYNAYFNTTNPGSETHGQTSGSNPFSNYPTSFQLASETNTGNTLSSPYNVDATGASRPGTDGIWTRGALQFISGGTVVPATPVGLFAKVQ